MIEPEEALVDAFSADELEEPLSEPLTLDDGLSWALEPLWFAESLLDVEPLPDELDELPSALLESEDALVDTFSADELGEPLSEPLEVDDELSGELEPL